MRTFGLIGNLVAHPKQLRASAQNRSLLTSPSFKANPPAKQARSAPEVSFNSSDRADAPSIVANQAPAARAGSSPTVQ
jgi:hypothetical protein